MATVSYSEKWAEKQILEESVLGPFANEVEATRRIETLQNEIGPAIDNGSQAALRDWRKICELKHKIRQNFEGPTRKRQREDGASDVANDDSEEDRGAEPLIVSNDPRSWVGRIVSFSAEMAASKKLPQVPMTVVHAPRK